MKINTSVYKLNEVLNRIDVLPEKDFIITGVSSTSYPKSNTLIYINKGSNKINFNEIINCLLIIHTELISKISIPKESAVVISMNPRLEYAQFCEVLVKLNTVKKHMIQEN